VVNIVTHTGLTFQGTDATVRQGFLEQFTTAELRHGFQIDEESGVFLYYGVADYQGADQDDSPYVFGRSFLARDNTQIIAGEPVTFDLNKDHHSYRSQARHKFHAQYTNGGLDVWVRYTRSGEQVEPERGPIAFPPIGTAPPGSSFADIRTFEVGYQQTTVFGSYTHELTDDLNVDVWLSYDTFDFHRINRADPNFNFREDEYYTRVLGRWQPVEAHTLALGFEYSHEIFGLPSRLTNQPAFTQRLRGNTTSWSTDTYSILGEHQWRINELWTTFLSGRVDTHTYSEWLFSPRAAVVFAPTDRDTFKFIAAQSVRRIGDDELRSEFLQNGTFGDAELLRGIEQRYERQQCEHLWFGLSAFYQDHAAVGFSGTAGRSLLLGEFQSWGLEPEISFRTEDTRYTLSHSYTKLVNGVLMDPTLIQGISAAGYGFGNDLANWSNHLTKLYLSRDLDECWSVSGSLRVYWDFPGARDLTDFNNARALGPLGPSTSIGLSDPGYEKAFRANVYLNGGLERKLGCCGAIRLDLYNVLGWFDKDLNKRNYINRVSEYRSEAAAVGLSMRMDF
jgi:iron complex outermembrane receptor protein